jgi:hypothetical protein
MTPQTVDVLLEVGAERERQDAKWGEQNHPDGTGAFSVREGGRVLPDEYVGAVRADRAREAKSACDRAAAEGRLTYLHILREEVAEAAAEHDPALLRAELVQVAAVAVKWIEAIDRRRRDA